MNSGGDAIRFAAHILFTAIWLFIGGTTSRAAPLQYSVLSLAEVGSVGTAVNNQGQVAGTLPNGHSFIHDGALHDLGPNGSSSKALGINSSGVVVGNSPIFGEVRAFIYNGTMQTFGTTYTSAFAINDAGLITGRFITNNPGRVYAYIYDGAIHSIGSLGGWIAEGTAINNAGQVAGWSYLTDTSNARAFYYDGAMHNLGTLGGSRSRANGINDLGHVVGDAAVLFDAANHAYLYDSTMRDLGTLGGANSSAADVNNHGVVVGHSDMATSAITHAFIYSSIHGMLDLNALIDPASGWVVTRANAINDRGQITGVGRFNGGFEAAVLLTPVPEPPAGLLMTFAVIATGIVRRRRVRIRR